MHSWLLSFSEIFSPVISKTPSHDPEDEELGSGYPPVCALPGWAYARALAFRLRATATSLRYDQDVSVDKCPSEAD
jgi:hypothetical protein